MTDINIIIQNLQSEDIDLIERSLDYLGDVKSLESFDLILPFLNHTSEEVRSGAACNLSDLNDERAIPFLLKLLQEDNSQKVKKFVIEALGNFKNENILKAYIREVYKEKISRGLRQRLANNLKNYPCKEAREALVYLLLNDSDPYTYIPAVDSLYSMNDMSLLEDWEKINSYFNHEYINKVAQKAIQDLEVKE